MSAWAVPIPSTPDEALVWCQATLVWFAANHRGTEQPIGREALRSYVDGKRRAWIRRTLRTAALAAVVVVAVPGRPHSHVGARVARAALVFVLLAVQPWVRLRMAASRTLSRYFAEWEIVLNVIFLGAAGVLIAAAHLTVSEPMIRLPLRTGQVAALTIGAAAIIFMFGGATHIVRGVLDKADALPRLPEPAAGSAPAAAHDDDDDDDDDDAHSAQPDAKPAMAGPVDIPEYNRGRTIGNIERLVMLAVVILGNYEALGFILAAKGLIRAPEFRNRDFAEYFIVGSLSSVAVALVVGVGLRPLILFLWQL